MTRYNEGLRQHQNTKRNETIQLIENAINQIKDFEGENTDITAKKLEEQTNLSRSALYKEHALKIWNPKLWEERYIKKSQLEKKIEKIYTKDLEALQKQIVGLNNEIDKLYQKNTKLAKKLETEKKRREVKEIETEEAIEKYKKLLAECQRLNNLLYSRNL